MSQLSEPPGGKNSPEGKEARLAKLLKREREKELSVLSEKIFLLNRKIYQLDFFDEKEWEEFFNELGGILKDLSKLNALVNNQELDKECQEVLLLIDKRYTTKTDKYKSVVRKLYDWFYDNKIFRPPTLP